MKARKGAQIRKIEGLPVSDATEDFEIVISRGDISNSSKKSPENCAAARACKRVFHRDVKVHMSRLYIKSRNKKSWTRYITPESVAREIISFDGSEFVPGIYKFRAPKDTERLGYYHRGGHKTGKGKKRIKIHFTANVRRKRTYDAPK